MKGILPVGIKYAGKIHRDFEVRARKVKDSIEATADPEVCGSDSLLGLAILSRQIISLGTIPKEHITWQLLYDAWEEDLTAIDSGTREAAKQLHTFPGDSEGGKEVNPGADEAGVLKS